MICPICEGKFLSLINGRCKDCPAPVAKENLVKRVKLSIVELREIKRAKHKAHNKKYYTRSETSYAIRSKEWQENKPQN